MRSAFVEVWERGEPGRDPLSQSDERAKLLPLNDESRIGGASKTQILARKTDQSRRGEAY